jgi:hypothetical protein
LKTRLELVLLLGFVLSFAVTVPYLMGQPVSHFSSTIALSPGQTYTKKLPLSEGDTVLGSFQQSVSLNQIKYVITDPANNVIMSVSKTDSQVSFNFSAKQSGNYSLSVLDTANSTSFIGSDLTIYHRPLIPYAQPVTPLFILLPSMVSGLYYDLRKVARPVYSRYSILSIGSQFSFLFFEILLQIFTVPGTSGIQAAMLAWILISLFIVLLAGSLAGSRVAKSFIWFGSFLWLIVAGVLLAISELNGTPSVSSIQLVENLATMVLLAFILFSSTLEAVRGEFVRIGRKSSNR